PQQNEGVPGRRDRVEHLEDTHAEKAGGERQRLRAGVAARALPQHEPHDQRTERSQRLHRRVQRFIMRLHNPSDYTSKAYADSADEATGGPWAVYSPRQWSGAARICLKPSSHVLAVSPPPPCSSAISSAARSSRPQASSRVTSAIPCGFSRSGSSAVSSR